MSIDKNDIEKYIFDPENPNQCKSYKLLLRIAKKENHSFFSPNFLQYFFGNEILNDEFKEDFFDLPKNYDSLTYFQKISEYKKQLSINEFKEFIDNFDSDKINTNKILQYSFFKNLKDRSDKQTAILVERKKEEFADLILEEISYNDTNYFEKTFYSTTEYNEHFIIFSKNFFNILNATISKSSIFITLEKNIDNFLSYKYNKNIKPIFLKKIEDVDLLLNILEQDMRKEKNKHITKEEISTIDNINIKDFFSIKDLKLENLKDKKEIYILGENGDGKTLLLQAIAISLKGVQKDGQERFREIQDTFNLGILNSDNTLYTSIEDNIYKNLFAYGSNRNNNCQIKEDEVGYLTLFDNSLDLKDPIKWLQFLDYSENKDEDNIISVSQAKQLIKDILNSDVEIEINPSEVTFTEKGSIVEFDRLSAGYKGVVTIICDMLVRLSENQPYVTNVKDYQGIVLIDEVELHLHPKWKYNFMKKLRDIFPLIQFIVTTHSPTVILGASKEAVFYKIYKDEGEVCISNQIKNEGYTNNSLISSPLFDLKSITSRNYDKKVSSDDFIYEKIHKVVSKRIENNINIDEDEILKLIDEELDKI